MKIVINTCYGGFGLSEAAYEKLIELGVPVRPYVEQKQDPVTRLYIPERANEGRVIFDNNLSERKVCTWSGRYWDSWISDDRANPLLVRVVEDLGRAASGPHADLAVVEIPDGIQWHIDEYDGIETVHEAHQSWS